MKGWDEIRKIRRRMRIVVGLMIAFVVSVFIVTVIISINKGADGKDDFWHFGRDREPKFPCAEAWDCISRYIYTALQGGSIMHGWSNDDRIMIACCNDGTRPVIFKIERIDVPENDEDRQWLASHDFRIKKEDAYTGA